ncbi:MAG: hypothetical protein AB7S56_10010 [Halothiobacillaceae bacterium]
MRCLSCDWRKMGLVCALALLAGCAVDAPPRDGAKKDSFMQPSSQLTDKGARFGKVESVRQVVMERATPPYGRGAENKAASEGLAQTMTAMLAPKPMGVELVVRLEDGADIKVVQPADVAFRAGDRVRVMRGADGTPRVTY